jgi:hypothetical protein
MQRCGEAVAEHSTVADIQQDFSLNVSALDGFQGFPEIIEGIRPHDVGTNLALAV